MKILDDAVPAYRTRDLSEAAALVCELRTPPTIERGEGHLWFAFTHPGAEELSRRFWSSTLSIDAREYSLSLRSIKDLMHRGPRDSSARAK